MAQPAEPDVLSVADLDRRLKRAVEATSADVWVEGEVSGARPAASGHLYFCLKDEREDAMIDCVMYRSSSIRSRQLVADGARIQLRGRATVWAPRGRLQFVGEQARPVGRGALLEALEKLKAKLLAEGLFAPERKRPLPREPKVVGVVTSASGAAIHDIAKVAFRRGGVRILLSPSLVQGQLAAASIVEALDRLEMVAELDVVVVGRGGGSADDLMVFNDEAVVRRVARCRVPVVSAVGHEIDVTLTDLAADARAATPSQAAEMLVPDAVARRTELSQLEARIRRAMRARLGEDRSVLERLAGRFGHLRLVVSERQQQLDESAARLRDATRRIAARRRVELERLHRRLATRHPRSVVADSRAELGPLSVRLESAMRACVEARRAALGEGAARLSALSPLAVLARGYAIATTASGRAIRAATEVSRGDAIAIRVHVGRVRATVDGVEPTEGRAPSRPTEPS